MSDGFGVVDKLMSLDEASSGYDAQQSIMTVNVFSQCYDQVMTSLNPETRQKVKDRLSFEVTQYDPYVLFTSEGLKAASKLVFLEDLEFRSFINRLTTLFLSRLTKPYYSYISLCTQLAWAHSIGNDDDVKLCLVPDDLQSRLSTMEQNYEVLINNKWFVTLVMLHQNVVVEVQTSERKQPIDQATRPLRG